jgi:hypothetical protein
MSPLVPLTAGHTRPPLIHILLRRTCMTLLPELQKDLSAPRGPPPPNRSHTRAHRNMDPHVSRSRARASASRRLTSRILSAMCALAPEEGSRRAAVCKSDMASARSPRRRWRAPLRTRALMCFGRMLNAWEGAASQALGACHHSIRATSQRADRMRPLISLRPMCVDGC